MKTLTFSALDEIRSHRKHLSLVARRRCERVRQRQVWKVLKGNWISNKQCMEWRQWKESSPAELEELRAQTETQIDKVSELDPLASIWLDTIVELKTLEKQHERVKTKMNIAEECIKSMRVRREHDIESAFSNSKMTYEARIEYLNQIILQAADEFERGLDGFASSLSSLERQIESKSGATLSNHFSMKLELSQLKLEMKHLSEEAEAQRRALTAELQDKDLQIELLHSKLREQQLHLEAKMEDHITSQANLTSQIEMLQDELEQKNLEITQLQQAMDDEKSHSQALNLQFNAKESSLQGEMIGDRTKITELEALIQTKEDELLQNNEFYQEYTRKLQRQLCSNQEENKRQQEIIAELRSSQAASHSHRSSLERLVAAIDQIQQEVSSIHHDEEMLCHACTHPSSPNGLPSHSHAELERENIGLKKQNEVLSQELDRASEALLKRGDNFSESVKSLQLQLEASGRDLEMCQEKARTLRASLYRVKEIIEDAIPDCMNDTVLAKLMQGKDFLEDELSSSLLISSPKRANRTVESSHLDVSVKRRLEEISLDVTRVMEDLTSVIVESSKSVDASASHRDVEGATRTSKSRGFCLNAHRSYSDVLLAWREATVRSRMSGRRNMFSTLEYFTNADGSFNDCLVAGRFKKSELEVKAEKTGSGTFADVYRSEIRFPCVTKKMRAISGSDDLNSFVREGEMMRNLRHPNIVKMLGIHIHNNTYSYVLEFAQGVNLFDYLHKMQKSIAFTSQIKIHQQVCDAVAYIHSNRVMHRDLKPQNIIYRDSSSSIKICDFGLATFIPEGLDEVDPMHVGTGGTPAYLAPEILKRKAVGFKADAYSYAVVMWETFTRRLPWADCNLEQMTNRVVQAKDRPRCPAEMPQDLSRLIADCWHDEPARRKSFEEILECLRQMN
uniref:Protein kinase domain-containing protein n=2 Tax=Guillardia theta TaxID=55529 RepID=A0A7S4PD68_GUITH